MLAMLQNRTFPHHHDDVAVLNGGEAVRNGEGGATGPGSLKCRPHHLLTLCVQRAGRLVQQEDRRIPNQGPADGHALLLPSGETVPARANLCVPALRGPNPPVNEIEVRHALALSQPLFGDRLVVFKAVFHVAQHCAFEEDRLLPHEANLLPPPPDVDLAQVSLGRADQDGPGLGIVEALEHGHDSALPAARWPDQPDGTAEVDRETELIQHLDVRAERVVEVDPSELDLPNVFVIWCEASRFQAIDQGHAIQELEHVMGGDLGLGQVA
eukprot:CAMPEP_0180467284 /NCGR_PEP_ID=MMETSP1036_2-20121128/26920_1 /TAXON_ID=632150 /ORGANISM="Azadinium spinosum, Strain 3D9" /LENGTH=268 /DNA_ID=CAMNT_0022474241 /DNA_START=250 /DNA_END=1053 /DNA_ORIENTATION=-